jgi:hypothetical protein
VGAVDGLGFDGGVPPGVEEDDVGSGGKVEAESAGLERDEEDGVAFSGLEFPDEGAAVLGLAGEEERVPLAGVHLGLEEFEEGDELREDEDLLALLHEGFELFDEGLDLGAGSGGIGLDEFWVTADLAEAEQ